MTHTRFVIGTMGISLLMAVGCTANPGPDTGGASGSLVENAFIQGNMVTVNDFEGFAYEISDSPNYVRVDAGRRGGADFGWVMMGISVYNYDGGSYGADSQDEGFLGDDFAPGAHYISTEFEEGPNISIQGCSGPEHGNWDWDGGANEIELWVEEGPEAGDREFHLVANYPEGQVAELEFTIPHDSMQNYDATDPYGYGAPTREPSLPPL